MRTAMETESFTLTISSFSSFMHFCTSSQHSYMYAVSPGSLPAQLNDSMKWMSS